MVLESQLGGGPRKLFERAGSNKVVGGSGPVFSWLDCALVHVRYRPIVVRVQFGGFVLV